MSDFTIDQMWEALLSGDPTTEQIVRVALEVPAMRKHALMVFVKCMLVPNLGQVIALAKSVVDETDLVCQIIDAHVVCLGGHQDDLVTLLCAVPEFIPEYWEHLHKHLGEYMHTTSKEHVVKRLCQMYLAAEEQADCAAPAGLANVLIQHVDNCTEAALVQLMRTEKRGSVAQAREAYLRLQKLTDHEALLEACRADLIGSDVVTYFSKLEHGQLFALLNCVPRIAASVVDWLISQEDRMGMLKLLSIAPELHTDFRSRVIEALEGHEFGVVDFSVKEEVDLAVQIPEFEESRREWLRRSGDRDAFLSYLEDENPSAEDTVAELNRLPYPEVLALIPALCASGYMFRNGREQLVTAEVLLARVGELTDDYHVTMLFADACNKLEATLESVLSAISEHNPKLAGVYLLRQVQSVDQDIPIAAYLCLWRTSMKHGGFTGTELAGLVFGLAREWRRSWFGLARCAIPSSVEGQDHWYFDPPESRHFHQIQHLLMLVLIEFDRVQRDSVREGRANYSMIKDLLKELRFNDPEEDAEPADGSYNMWLVEILRDLIRGGHCELDGEHLVAMMVDASADR